MAEMVRIELTSPLRGDICFRNSGDHQDRFISVKWPGVKELNLTLEIWNLMVPPGHPRLS